MSGLKGGFSGLVLIGFKHSGKSSVGKLLAAKLQIPFIDIDDVIEKIHKKSNAAKTVRQIYSELGEQQFLKLENVALEKTAEAIKTTPSIIAFGGATPFNSGFNKGSFAKTVFVYLDVLADVLFKRIEAGGFPPFYDKTSPRHSFDEIYMQRVQRYEKIAEIRVDNSAHSVEVTAEEIIEKLEGMDVL